MKKITLLILFCVCAITYGQNRVSTMGGNNPVNKEAQQSDVIQEKAGVNQHGVQDSSIPFVKTVEGRVSPNKNLQNGSTSALSQASTFGESNPQYFRPGTSNSSEINMDQPGAVNAIGENNPVYYRPGTISTQVNSDESNAVNAKGENNPVYYRPGTSSTQAGLAEDKMVSTFGTNNPVFAKEKAVFQPVPRVTTGQAVRSVDVDFSLYISPKRAAKQEVKKVVSIPFETEREILANNLAQVNQPEYVMKSSTNGVGSRMADIIPTAGATETFTPSVGDNFFDPGGPGGSSTGGTAGNYPNCACTTLTTLAGVTEIVFNDFSVFATFDWLRIYDSADTTGTVLFDNGTGGANQGDITLADMIASHGSDTFVGTSGDMTFEFFATGVVDYGGWDSTITVAGGGGGGGGGTASNVLYLHHDTDTVWNDDVVTQLTNAGVPVVDLWDGTLSMPTVADLQAYDAVLVSTDFAPGDPTALGNILADFADNGGRIVEMLFSADGGFGIGGNFAANYSLWAGTGIQTGARVLGTVLDPAHPTMQGVNTFSGGGTSFHLGGAAKNGGVVIAEYDDGTSLLVVNEDIGPANVRTAYINFFPPSDATGSGILWDSTTDGAILMKNALDWVADTGGGGGGGGGACSETNTSNAFENGLSYAAGSPFAAANDITVAADEDFELQQITYNSFHVNGETIDSVDINYYDDAGGLPGALIGSELGVVPTSQTFLGTNFGFDISEMVLDITPVMFAGQAGATTTYWVEFVNGVSSAGGAAFWEISANAVNGNAAATSNAGAYTIFDPLLDGVYTWDGDCTPIGGGGGGPCSETNTSNAFENGLSYAAGSPFAAANDITVNADEDFELQQITYNSFHVNGETIDSVDINYYDDAGGLPGALIGSELGVAPTSQTFLGTNFGFDISEMVLDITPVMFAGQAGATTTYWVEFVNGTSSAGGAVFWEISANAVNGNAAATSNAGAYTIFDPLLDGVYTWDGDCTPIGGGGGGPCSETNTSNAFENGLSYAAGSPFAAANDITVAADEDFELQQITYNSFHVNGETIDSVDINYYDDAGGLPGALIGSELGVAPTSQTFLGTNFGFDISEMVLDITPVMFAGQAGATTTYWVEFVNGVSSAGGAVFWEISANAVNGNAAATSNAGAYTIFDPLLDGVYTWDGDCTPIGGGGGGPCSETNTSNAFENGLSYAAGSPFAAANDITVNADEDFELQQITYNSFHVNGETIDSVDINYYDDAGGLPGALIGSELGVAPTSQTFLGTNFGFDISEMVLDITPVMFAGQAGATTTYWVEFVNGTSSAGGAVFWEISANAVNGNAAATSNAGAYTIFDPLLDGVYTWDGNCTPIGGGGGCADPGELSTTLDGGNGNFGNMFDINALADITIDSFNIHGDTGAVFDVEVYAKEGTYVGFEADAAAWTLIGTAPGVVSNGDGVVTPLDLELNYAMLGGTTHAFFVTPTDTTTGGFNYTNGTNVGDIFAADLYMEFLEGAGSGIFDGNVFSPRVFNGDVLYCINGDPLPLPPPNDMIANSIDVDEIGFPYTDPAVEMAYATLEAGTPAGCDNAGVRGVWYNFVPFGDGDATAVVVSPAGFSSVTFYTAPNENAVETDLVLVDWFENQCLPGITATIPTVAGQAYYVYVANHDGVTDITIDGTNLGTADNTIEGFSYYPNPSTSIVNLTSVEVIESVTIYNMLGQKVVDQNIDATTSEVNVSKLATGTYLMKVSVNGQVGTYRILKQ